MSQTERSFLADAVETGIHKYSDDVVAWIDKLIPQGIKNWLAENGFWKEVISKGLLAGSVLVGRKIPNSPNWRLVDSAIKALAAEVSDRIDKLDAANGIIDLSSDKGVLKKVSALSGAVRLGVLELDEESLNNVMGWIETLSKEGGAKALSMLNEMPVEKLAGFAVLDHGKMSAYLDAFIFKSAESVKPKPKKNLEFLQIKRKDVSGCLNRLDKELEKLKAEDVRATERLALSKAIASINMNEAKDLWQDFSLRQAIPFCNKSVEFDSEEDEEEPELTLSDPVFELENKKREASSTFTFEFEEDAQSSTKETFYPIAGNSASEKAETLVNSILPLDEEFQEMVDNALRKEEEFDISSDPYEDLIIEENDVEDCQLPFPFEFSEEMIEPADIPEEDTEDEEDAEQMLLNLLIKESEDGQ